MKERSGIQGHVCTQQAVQNLPSLSWRNIQKFPIVPVPMHLTGIDHNGPLLQIKQINDNFIYVGVILRVLSKTELF